ncbi:MHD domain-containing protein [Balamuthia mandrillaris]
MALCHFFVLSPRGEPIIFRDYRGESSHKDTAEVFFSEFKKHKGAKPIFNVEGLNYCCTKQYGLYFVCTTKHNLSPSFVLELLCRIGGVFKDYCGVLNEEAVRKNFVLLYELLDEMLDYGYPQVLSTEALKAFVFNEAVLVDDAPPPSSKDVGALGIYALNKLVDNLSLSSPGPAAKDKPLALTMKDERNHKNELFVDLIERLTVLFSPQGTKLKAEINGFIRMTSFLKGTPEVRLALNEDLVVGRRDDRSARYGLVTLDDITFHECARLDLFEMDRSLSLHPPDGEFVLLNYRISEDFALPFYITPIVEQPQTGGPYRVDLMIKIRLDIPDDQQAVNVIIKCPLPKCVESANCELHLKGVSYQVNKNVAEWSIQEFAGGSDLFLRCRITLKEVYDATIRKEFGPISLDFELPMYNCSNVQIRYLRVVERDKSYNPLRWVRNITQAHSYICRV